MNRSERRRHAQQLAKQHGPSEQASEESGGSEDKTPLASKIMPTEPQQNKTYCKPNDTPWWKVFLEAGALAAGVCAVVVYKGQWDAAKTANVINTKNAKAQQRAWVGLDITDADNPITIPKEGFAPTWLLHFRNFGNSPALHVKVHTHLYEWQRPTNWDYLQYQIEHLDTDQKFEGTLMNGARIPNFGKSEVLSTFQNTEPVRSGFGFWLLAVVLLTTTFLRITTRLRFAFCTLLPR